MSLHRLSLVAAAAVTISGSCSCTRAVPQPYSTPSLEEIVTHLRSVQARARAFQAESVMDYWAGDERVKADVLVMGQIGAKIRFNALNPTGGDVAADLACDGRNFAYVDFNNNCYLAGECTRDAIAQLLRVSLEPDDFLLLAVGSTPLIDYDKGTVEWDSKNGTWVVQLVSEAWRQRIVLDSVGRRWDVLQSTVHDAEGKVEWSLHNKDFSAATGEDGATFRVPGRTKFEQPKAKADLAVRWKERTLNPEIDDAKFSMEIPAGLRSCRERE